MLNVNQTSRVLEAVESADRVICVCHDNPDGDAIGSMLGLASALRARYVNRKIIGACEDAIPSAFHFIDGASAVDTSYEPRGGDLVFILDTAEPRLTGFYEKFPRMFVPGEAGEDGLTTVKIDHHPVGADFAHFNFVDSEAASSCEIVVDMLDSMDFAIGANAATALLTGIYTDTGSMMHSNTSQRVYRTCARLLNAGADRKTIVDRVYRTSKISTLKLWGRVLEKISLTDEGGAVSAVTMADFRASGADFSELSGAIDYVNSIPGMKFSMILSERNGKVKGSLRTLREDVDVSAMARRFSGGGHKKAAGFTIKGKLEEERRWKVVPPP